MMNKAIVKMVIVATLLSTPPSAVARCWRRSPSSECARPPLSVLAARLVIRRITRPAAIRKAMASRSTNAIRSTS